MQRIYQEMRMVKSYLMSAILQSLMIWTISDRLQLHTVLLEDIPISDQIQIQTVNMENGLRRKYEDVMKEW